VRQVVTSFHCVVITLNYSKIMRILVFSWRDPKHPLAGGAEQVMHEHMKGWIKAGHKVTLFSSKMGGLPEEEEMDGVHIVRHGYQYLGVQITGFFFYLKNKDNFDFIVDQFHGLPFFTPLYVQKPKLAVIQEAAKDVWFMNPLFWPLNWVVGVIGYLGEPFIFLIYKGTKFMTGSASAKEEVEKLGIPGNKITVIPHGVVLEKPKIISAKEKIFTLVFLGVLSKDKGIENALACFLKLKDYKFQFWVVGKPETKEYGEKIKNLVKRLDLKEKIKFFGFVSQKEKFELLSRSHLLINPSAREGWGLVNIEANSMGVPVVAYKSAGLVDSVNDGKSGVFCDKNSPEDLAESVLELSKDWEKYEKLSKGAFLWSREFSWDKSSDLSRKLINEILG